MKIKLNKHNTIKEINNFRIPIGLRKNFLTTALLKGRADGLTKLGHVYIKGLTRYKIGNL